MTFNHDGNKLIITDTIQKRKRKKYSNNYVVSKIKSKIDFNKAIYFSTRLFKNVRKKINNNLKINIENNILNKRVNQLNIDELICIYDLF